MKRIIKFSAVVLGLIAVLMMLFTQVTVVTSSGAKIAVKFQALVGGPYKSTFLEGTVEGVASGLAGYILAGAGALIILVTILVPLFKEHDVLSSVVTGLGVICLIVGTILIFLIRKNFMEANGYESTKVLVGWAAITAGSCASLAAAAGSLGMILDLSGNN